MQTCGAIERRSSCVVCRLTSLVGHLLAELATRCRTLNNDPLDVARSPRSAHRAGRLDIRPAVSGVGLTARRLPPLAPQVSQVGNSAVVEWEAVTLRLDHAFGFEFADVSSAEIEELRQCRCAASRARGSLGDGRAANGGWLSHRVRSCCVAVGGSLQRQREGGSAFGGIADPAQTCHGSTRSRMTPRRTYGKLKSRTVLVAVRPSRY